MRRSAGDVEHVRACPAHQNHAALLDGGHGLTADVVAERDALYLAARADQGKGACGGGECTKQDDRIIGQSPFDGGGTLGRGGVIASLNAIRLFGQRLLRSGYGFIARCYGGAIKGRVLRFGPGQSPSLLV